MTRFKTIYLSKLTTFHFSVQNSTIITKYNLCK